MPEQITKYPDVTLQVLREGGARCGEGVEKKILKACPTERFCSLPTGEMCIYGIAEIPRMTQIAVKDLAPIVCTNPSPRTEERPQTMGSDVMPVSVAFVAGLAVATAWRRFRRR